MPDHIHGIIWLTDVGAQRRCTPTQENFCKPIAGSLPTIVRSSRAAVTYKVNKTRGESQPPFLQRNYFERVIRNESELTTIREHIAHNRLKWDLDRDNPKNIINTS